MAPPAPGGAAPARPRRRSTTPAIRRPGSFTRSDRLPPSAAPLPMARESVKVGSRVLWLGHPLKVNSTFSVGEGTVRSVGTEAVQIPVGDEILRVKARMVTSTIPVAQAASGGPVI